MKQIIFSKDAMKYLARMPQDSARNIIHAIKRVAGGTGKPSTTKKLAGRRDEYRLRLGGLRVIYKLENENNVILVVKIGPRGDVYK